MKRRVTEYWRTNTALCILLLGILSATSLVLSAGRLNQIDFTSGLESGSVDIELLQYQVKDGKLQLAENRLVMPGEEVSYIPEIANLRAAAYVRLAVEIDMDEEISKPITIDSIYGLSDEWVKRGEYFYLNRVLKSNERVRVFEGIAVPKQWTRDDSAGFVVRLKADAIQAEGFVPDFNSSMPWGSVQIETAKEGDLIEYGKASKLETKSKTLVYTGQSGFEASCGDLFEDFSHYMAGGSFSDELEIKNESSNAMELYFRTRNTGSYLNDEMRLELSLGERSVYEGNLTATDMNEYQLLTRIDAGSRQTLRYTVKLPEASQNVLSILSDSVVWEFKTVELPTSAADSPIIEAVRTGDDTELMPYAIVSLLAMLGLWLSLRSSDRRKGK